jgi:hypothetical protein
LQPIFDPDVFILQDVLIELMLACDDLLTLLCVGYLVALMADRDSVAVVVPKEGVSAVGYVMAF